MSSMLPPQGYPQGTVPMQGPNGLPPQAQGGLPMPGAQAPAAGMQGQMPGAMGAQTQISPEMINAVLALQSQQPKQAQIQRQMRLADQLRAQAPGMMQSQSPINTPNWAGTLAGMAAMYKANKGESEANAAADELANKRASAYRQYFEGAGGGE